VFGEFEAFAKKLVFPTDALCSAFDPFSTFRPLSLVEIQPRIIKVDLSKPRLQNTRCGLSVVLQNESAG
jgi:hypothetical protein